MLILTAAEFGNSAEHVYSWFCVKLCVFVSLCSIIKDYKGKHSGISGWNGKTGGGISYLCSVKGTPLREPQELIV